MGGVYRTSPGEGAKAIEPPPPADCGSWYFKIGEGGGEMQRLPSVFLAPATLKAPAGRITLGAGLQSETPPATESNPQLNSAWWGDASNREKDRDVPGCSSLSLFPLASPRQGCSIQ